MLLWNWSAGLGREERLESLDRSTHLAKQQEALCSIVWQHTHDPACFAVSRGFFALKAHPPATDQKPQESYGLLMATTSSADENLHARCSCGNSVWCVILIESSRLALQGQQLLSAAYSLLCLVTLAVTRLLTFRLLPAAFSRAANFSVMTMSHNLEREYAPWALAKHPKQQQRAVGLPEQVV